MSKKSVWVGDNDHDPESAGFQEIKRPKVHVTTFKSRAKRIKKQKPKPVATKTEKQNDWFDDQFEKMKQDSFWNVGGY